MPGPSSTAPPTLVALALLLPMPAAAFPPVQSANIPGGTAAVSPVVLGDVDGDGLPDVVFGDANGKAHAFRYAGGTLAFVRTFDTGLTLPIEGRPAIGNVDGDPANEVVFGTNAANHAASTPGRIWVFDGQTGALQCSFTASGGVYSSPALADLDFDDGGQLEIVFGAWDRHIRALHHDCTVLWDRFVDDTVWSSPAIADLDGDGDPDVVIGSDASNSPLAGGWDGGLAIAFEGKTGATLAGFPALFDEVVSSSPAVGDIVPGGNPELAVGTGFCWANPACAPGGNDVPGAGEYLIALDSGGDPLPGWPRTIAGRHAFASPAIADLDGDGDLEVVVNSIQRSTLPSPEGGRVHVLEADGSDATGWPQAPSTPTDCSGGQIHFGTGASPVVADVDGDGELNVVLPSNHELVIWDAGGTQLTRDQLTGLCAPDPGAWELVAGNSMASPGVGDLDGDGDLEVAGASLDGKVYVWDFPPGTAGSGAAPWPMFKADSEGTSSAVGLPIFADGFESGDTLRWTSTTGG